MTWTLSDSGTKTATVPSTCTFTNGSANIGVTNTCTAGDIVVFTTTGGLPTNFAVLTTYYVIATSLSSSNIQVSATSGGGAITAGSAGTGTQTGTFEHILATDTNNATFEGQVQTSNMALVDLVELRAYTINLSGGVLIQTWKGAFQNAQINNQKVIPFVASDQSMMLTLKQLAGTGRAFAWKILRQ